MKNPFPFIVVMLFSLPVFAQQCDPDRSDTTPDQLFIMYSNGTVQDKRTGLLWMRCAIGQTWRDEHCAFGHLTYDFYQADTAAHQLNRDGGFAGYRDWRLPTLKELTSIVEQRCEDPAINSRAFPDNPVTGYWTSTEDPDYPRGAMLVHILNGRIYMSNKKVAWGLRLVRNN